MRNSIIPLLEDSWRWLANQWDKHRGANPQFSLVSEIHISVKLTHTQSLVLGKVRTRAEMRELWRGFLYSNKEKREETNTCRGVQERGETDEREKRTGGEVILDSSGNWKKNGDESRRDRLGK